MHALFVYGTLRHPPLLDRLISRVPHGVAASLDGWRAAALRDRVYPGLLPASGQRADGLLIDVDDRELVVLDRFEGDHYQRIGVRVTARAEEFVATAWRLRAEHASLALPTDWSFGDFVAREAATFLGDSHPGRRHPRPDD